MVGCVAVGADLLARRDLLRERSFNMFFGSLKARESVETCNFLVDECVVI